MKVAIFHNFLDNIGGAEKVGLILARELNADIYTTNIDAQKISKMGFADILPKIHSIGKVPLNAPFRQSLALWKFSRLNLKSEYDFYIIDGDWAMSAALHNKPNLWYVHSPIREIWDLYEYSRNNTVPWLLRPIFDLWVAYNRYLNRKYVKEVGKIACNSHNTQKRVEKYLGRRATVIYPPIETEKFALASRRMTGSYWLSVNRLISHKRIDVQLEAFASLPNEKLIIVGSYENSRHFLEYANYCKKIRPENVEIKSWVSQDELIGLYANCKGFITTSKDEDFGMNVVEAMASGKPVIAPNEGGYKETCINGQTGILIDRLTPQNLKKAIEAISVPEDYKKACFEQAQKFNRKKFISKIKTLIG